MKKVISSIVIFTFIQYGYSQNSNPSTTLLDSLSNQVIHYLRNKQADSIYALTGEEFRNQLTKEDFKNISENQLFPLNNFEKVAFVKNINGINKYKVDGAPDLQLFIGLDKKNMIQTLLVQPYQEN